MRTQLSTVALSLTAMILCVGPAFAADDLPRVWTTSFQTGMADTFQLTLGGMFGGGPAWQNRTTVTGDNVFRGGDSISGFGWNSLDMGRRDNSWQAGIGYKVRLFRSGRHSVTVGSGVQRWLLPTVKTGARDWLVPGNLCYKTKVWRVPIMATADSWSLLDSTLPKGSLLHTQLWAQHQLFKSAKVQVTLRHGPAHTYSWNFYGTNGSRIVRYQSMLAIAMGKVTIEGGYRKQFGLQNGIADNCFWQFAVTRVVALSHPR